MAKNAPAGAQRYSRGSNPNDNSVQRTRAWSGFCVVFAGDLAIAAAALFTVWKVSKSGGSGDTTPIVAILTSAFTAIGTMTTAYFGIKTMSNTAQSFSPAATAAANNATTPPATPPAPPGRVAPTGPPAPARGPAPANLAGPVFAAAPVFEDAAFEGDSAFDGDGASEGDGVSGDEPQAEPGPDDAEIISRMQEPF